MYFHKPQEKPRRWGSFQDVQYAIRKNAEKIYQIDPDSMVLCMPLFWGLPPLDYSGKNNHGTNHGATYKDGSLDFSTISANVQCSNTGMTDTNYFLSFWVKPTDLTNAQYLFDQTTSVTGRRSVVLGYQNGYFNFYDGGYPTGQETDTRIIATADVLQYIVMGTDGTKVYGYKNGVKVVEEIGDWESTGATAFYIARGYWDFHGGPIDEVHISNVTRTANQIALFHDLPWALYQPVSRPIYFFQAAEGISIPVAMQNMRGGFNPIGMRGGFINAD